MHIEKLKIELVDVLSAFPGIDNKTIDKLIHIIDEHTQPLKDKVAGIEVLLMKYEKWVNERTKKEIAERKKFTSYKIQNKECLFNLYYWTKKQCEKYYHEKGLGDLGEGTYQIIGYK